MKRILVFGDSNTYGANPEWSPVNPGVPNRLPQDIRWPGVLQNLLGRDEYQVIEEGLCGRTTVFRDDAWPWCEGRAYLQPCILSHYPLDLIIIMLGTNDLKAVHSPAADSLALAMQELLKTALNPFLYPDGIVPKILLISPIRIGDGLESSFMYGSFTEQSRNVSYQLPVVYKTVADGLGCAFMDAGQFAEASAADSVHMDGQNHEKLARAVYQKVKELCNA